MDEEFGKFGVYWRNRMDRSWKIFYAVDQTLLV
jgi:hypothetical protein